MNKREQQKERIRQLAGPKRENLSYYRQRLKMFEGLYRSARTPEQRASLEKEIKELRATITLYRDFPIEGIRTCALDAPGGRQLAYNPMTEEE